METVATSKLLSDLSCFDDLFGEDGEGNAEKTEKVEEKRSSTVKERKQHHRVTLESGGSRFQITHQDPTQRASSGEYSKRFVEEAKRSWSFCALKEDGDAFITKKWDEGTVLKAAKHLLDTEASRRVFLKKEQSKVFHYKKRKCPFIRAFYYNCSSPSSSPSPSGKEGLKLENEETKPQGAVSGNFDSLFNDEEMEEMERIEKNFTDMFDVEPFTRKEFSENNDSLNIFGNKPETPSESENDPVFCLESSSFLEEWFFEFSKQDYDDFATQRKWIVRYDDIQHIPFDRVQSLGYTVLSDFLHINHIESSAEGRKSSVEEMDEDVPSSSIARGGERRRDLISKECENYLVNFSCIPYLVPPSPLVMLITRTRMPSCMNSHIALLCFKLLENLWVTYNAAILEKLSAKRWYATMKEEFKADCEDEDARYFSSIEEIVNKQTRGLAASSGVDWESAILQISEAGYEHTIRTIRAWETLMLKLFVYDGSEDFEEVEVYVEKEKEGEGKGEEGIKEGLPDEKNDEVEVEGKEFASGEEEEADVDSEEGKKKKKKRKKEPSFIPHEKKMKKVWRMKQMPKLDKGKMTPKCWNVLLTKNPLDGFSGENFMSWSEEMKRIVAESRLRPIFDKENSLGYVFGRNAPTAWNSVIENQLRYSEDLVQEHFIPFEIKPEGEKNPQNAKSNADDSRSQNTTSVTEDDRYEDDYFAKLEAVYRTLLGNEDTKETLKNLKKEEADSFFSPSLGVLKRRSYAAGTACAKIFLLTWAQLLCKKEEEEEMESRRKREKERPSDIPFSSMEEEKNSI